MSYTRVERKNILQAEGNPGWYEVNLTLSTHGLTNAGSGTGGGSTDPFPVGPGAASSFVQYKGSNTGTVILDATPTDGHLLMCFIGDRDTSPPGPPTGFTTIANCANGGHGGTLSYRIASGESGTYVAPAPAGASIVVMELEGAIFDSYVSQSSIPGANVTCGGAITPSAPNAIVVGCAVVQDFWMPAPVTPAAGVTVIFENNAAGVSPNTWVGYKTVATPASTTVGGTNGQTPALDNFGGITFTLIPSSPGDPPVSGQPVEDETPTPDPDGVTTTFTAAYPFATGSLQVVMNGVELENGVDFIETDNAAGTFTFTYTPSANAQIVIRYLGL